MDLRGEVHTAPAALAAELRRHWQQVFSARRHDAALLRQWCSDELSGEALDGIPAGSSSCWSPSSKDVRRAIDQAPSSAPGPDGIPLVAWRMLGPLGASTLAAVLEAMLSGSGQALMDADFPFFTRRS